MKKLFTFVERESTGRENYRDDDRSNPFFREKMRDNDRDSARQFDTERKSRRDSEHTKCRETPNVSQHQYHSWGEQKRADDPNSSVTSDPDSHQITRDSLGKNGQDSTEGNGTTQHQCKSKTAHKSDGVRYDPLKMTSVKRIYGKTAIKSSEQHQSVAQSETSYMKEIQHCFDYYKRLKTGRFDCHICGNSLANRPSLVSHLTGVHRMKELPIDLRPVNKYIPRQIIKRFEAKNCIMCTSDYSSYEELKSHYKKHHEIDIHTCSYPLCNGVYLHKKKLEEHQKVAHSQMHVRFSLQPTFTISISIQK